MSIAGSRVNSAARSGVVSTIAALPSAGCVCPPYVTVPPGRTGFSVARPCGRRRVDAFVAGEHGARLPVARVGHLERQVHEAAQERGIVGQRVAVLRVAVQGQRVLARACRCRASRATFSAVSIIATPAYGSRSKLSRIQFSCSPVPPGASGAG